MRSGYESHNTIQIPYTTFWTITQNQICSVINTLLGSKTRVEIKIQMLYSYVSKGINCECEKRALNRAARGNAKIAKMKFSDLSLSQK
jgi:hypothetical protein